MSLKDLKLSNITATANPDGSVHYTFDASGVGAQLQKIPVDLAKDLQDGKISPEEGCELVGDVTTPEMGQKLLGYVMIARMLHVIKD